MADRIGDLAAFRDVGAVLHGDCDEFGRAFAVANDHLRQLLRNACDRFGQRRVVGRIQRIDAQRIGGAAGGLNGANAGGIGGELATARALFDIPRVMALIVAVVTFALITEYVFLHPLRDRLERWREAGLPWGIKR